MRVASALAIALSSPCIVGDSSLSPEVIDSKMERRLAPFSSGRVIPSKTTATAGIAREYSKSPEMSCKMRVSSHSAVLPLEDGLPDEIWCTFENSAIKAWIF